MVGNDPEVIVFDEFKFRVAAPSFPRATAATRSSHGNVTASAGVHVAIAYSALRATKPGA